MLFRQLFDRESSTYSYLLADQATREPLLIDSVLPEPARIREAVPANLACGQHTTSPQG